jgi:hypothetical protein
MNHDKESIVIGLLLHLGGVDIASDECKRRVVESVRPVDVDATIWQAQDGVLGAAWIVDLRGRGIMQLVADRLDGARWMVYRPTSTASVVHGNSDYNTATIAAFHDTKHDVAPPALLKIGETYVYRNISGNAVVVSSDLMEEILDTNHIV